MSISGLWGAVILLRPPSGCHQTFLKYTHGVSRSRHAKPFGIWQDTLWSGGQSEREEGINLIPMVNRRRCMALSSTWADVQSNRLKSLTWVTPRKTPGSDAPRRHLCSLLLTARLYLLVLTTEKGRNTVILDHTFLPKVCGMTSELCSVLLSKVTYFFLVLITSIKTMLH